MTTRGPARSMPYTAAATAPGEGQTACEAHAALRFRAPAPGSLCGFVADCPHAQPHTGRQHSGYCMVCVLPPDTASPVSTVVQAVARGAAHGPQLLASCSCTRLPRPGSRAPAGQPCSARITSDAAVPSGSRNGGRDGGGPGASADLGGSLPQVRMLLRFGAAVPR